MNEAVFTEGQKVTILDERGRAQATGEVMGRKPNQGWYTVRVNRHRPPYCVNYPPSRLEARP